MKILLLITGLNMGGAEIQVCQIAKYLKQRNYEVLVVSLTDLGPVSEKLNKDAINVQCLGMKKGSLGLRGLWKLRGLIESEKIDILHTHLFHANLLGHLIKLFNSNIKVISTIHNINIGGKHREFFFSITNKLSDLTTVVSSIAMKHLQKIKVVTGIRVQMLPNGINTDKFKVNKKERDFKRSELGLDHEFLWLAVGRFELAKNYPNMLAAFKRLVTVRNNARLYIVGIGPLMEEIKAFTKQLGVDGLVNFLGLRNDVHSLMNAADAYIMSSSWEGMPLVLLEAAASGLPILATDVGGNKEIVINGETGFLVEPENPSLLSSRMIEIMDLDLPTRISIGEKARKLVLDKYSIDKVVDNWERVYAQI